MQITLLSAMALTAFVAITVGWLITDKVSTEVYMPTATALILAAAGLQKKT